MIMILDMPEKVDDIGKWLDHHVASDHLMMVVDELSAVHGATTDSFSLDAGRSWLGASAAEVFQHGLGSLPHERVRELLRRPALLPAIQQLVMLEGGEYWDRLVREAQSLPSFETVACKATSQGLRPPPRRAARSRFWLATLPLAVAAGIGLFVLRERLADSVRPRDNGLTLTRGDGEVEDVSKATEPRAKWGWCRANLVADGTPPTAVPRILADSLGEWFVVSPAIGADPRVVQLQVSEMWDGCDRISSSSFKGMTPEAEQKVWRVAADLKDGLQLVLKGLREADSGTGGSSVIERAKKSVDDLVRTAIASLTEMNK